MFEPNEFVEVAEIILQTIEATYVQNAVDLPSRRYLSVGGLAATVHDCEQVTISFEQGYSGTPGNQAQDPVKCDAPRSGVYVVELVRAVPLPNTTAPLGKNGLAPSRFSDAAQSSTTVAALPPSVLTEMAKTQMRDAMLLMEAGLRAGQTTLTGAIVDVSAGTPQGGYQGMIMTVTASAVKQAL